MASDESRTTVADVAPAVARARAAQPAWAALDPSDRAEHVRRVKDRVLARAEEIAALVHDEVGKPTVEVLLGEVLASADVVEYWTASIEELLDRSEVELDPILFPGKSGFIYKEARGVVGLIQPWNFPLALPLRTLVPALLAGNAVVFKPSEVAPRTGALVGELFEGLPAGVLEIVQGAGDVGAALCTADVDLVCFTGSVATGRKVAHACAERLVPCALELGGKDAAIVLADANLDRAANGIVWGALTNAGQNCASVERVYVEQPVAEELTRKIVDAVEALAADVDVGPLSTDAQRDVVKAHVESAKAGGAEVLAGGSARGERGFEPTVLRVESDALDVMRDETFGPVVPIAVVADAEEAVERANRSRYGLTASIWTKNVRRGEDLARRLRAGVVTINNHAFTGAIPQAPWSGVGETGYGITNSPLALDALTRPRFVLTDKSRGKRELWWYPYTGTLETIALALARLRCGTRSLFDRVGALFTLLRAFPKRLGGG
jgi:acyl-CoA reductase-like NAD-dependent aldehyde dehydrogenase